MIMIRNEEESDYERVEEVKALTILPEKPQIWAVGERVYTRIFLCFTISDLC